MVALHTLRRGFTCVELDADLLSRVEVSIQCAAITLKERALLPGHQPHDLPFQNAI